MHHLALKAGRFPWELEEMDPPLDKLFRALSIEAADARGRTARLEVERRQRG